MSAKNVKRAPDGKVHPAPTQSLHQLQIRHRPRAPGVRDRDRRGGARPLSQEGDEVLVDAGLEAFGVGGVDEEFGAVRREEGEGGGGDGHGGEGGPLVGRDVPLWRRWGVGRHGGGGGWWEGVLDDTAAGEIDDQFGFVGGEGGEDGGEVGLGEG